MKKFAIGCLIVAAVVIVVGGILGYFFIWRPASSYIASFSQLGEIADLDKQVTNKASFTPPASGELNKELVDRFVKVQEGMEQALGPTFTQLKTKYDVLDKAMKSEKREATVLEGVNALKDLATVIVQAKRAQVQALNTTSFSLDEYRWVRGQAYAAAGLPLTQIDLEGIAAAAKEGGNVVRKAPEPGEIPAVNKELVAPYAEKLKEWIALGFFGL